MSGVGDADVLAAPRRRGNLCSGFLFPGRATSAIALLPDPCRGRGGGGGPGGFHRPFYQNRPPPRQVLIAPGIPNPDLVSEALSAHAGHRVEVLNPKRGDKRKLIDHAETNAGEALKRRFLESATQRRLLKGLAVALGLDAPPERIEVYDNSHVQGSDAVGAMIVAGPGGFVKSLPEIHDWRVQKDAAGVEADPADGFAPGDDYAMMRKF